MATLYSPNIFRRFVRKIQDYYHDNITLEDRNEEFGGYLESSVAKFLESQKDLSNRESIVNTLELFSGDGATASFRLATAPLSGSEYRIIIASAVVTSTGYSYSATGTVTFDTAPASGVNNISIECSFAGQFNETLNEIEEELISLMMVVEWCSPRIYDADLMQQVMGSKDFQIWSQANHIKEIKDLKKSMQLEIESYIIKYSYQGDISQLG